MFIPAHELVVKAKASITETSLEQADSLAADATVLLFDVREPGEYQEGHLPGALNIPRGMLEFVLSSNPALQDTDRQILVYCKTGGRAALAAQSLASMGFIQVSSLAGGYDAWHASARQTEQPTISFD